MSADRKSRNGIAILRVLRDGDGPLSSAQITSELAEGPRAMSERTVRLYLQQMEADGLIEHRGKRGSEITGAGRRELAASLVVERVGALSARIDRLTYSMSFDLATCTGEVVVNLSLVDPEHLAAALDGIAAVFERGLAMGDRVALLGPGERVGEVEVPPGRVGLGTVCSVTLNGVLLKHGIPVSSRFGGLLEVRGDRPRRFLEFINYDGTSVDPLEVFILGGMTSCGSLATAGDGRIGASFRELPPEAEERTRLLDERLRAIGLGGFLAIGANGEPLLDIPVIDGRIGAAVAGGLNPLAVVVEGGATCILCALSGLLEYNRLHHYAELPRRLAAL